MLKGLLAYTEGQSEKSEDKFRKQMCFLIEHSTSSIRGCVPFWNVIDTVRVFG